MLTDNIFNNSEVVVNDLKAIYDFNNTFITFKSINNILYLIYANKKNSIISYDLIENKRINEIKNSHEMNIISFRHIADKINKRDLILSMSGDDNNIKVWNINNFELLISIENINKQGYLYSSCFLYDNNQNYIITSCYNIYDQGDLVKVFNLKGILIKKFNNSSGTTIFIESYFNNRLSKNYIIANNKGYIKSFDYNKNELYNIYFDENNKFYRSIIINERNEEEKIQLIASSEDGHIKIWDFHSAEILKKIKISDDSLYDICLWKNDYLFVGCFDNIIKIVDLKKEIIIKELIGHNHRVITIKTIFHPQKGDCILTQAFIENSIKLWFNKT